MSCFYQPSQPLSKPQPLNLVRLTLSFEVYPPSPCPTPSGFPLTLTPHPHPHCKAVPVPLQVAEIGEFQVMTSTHRVLSPWGRGGDFAEDLSPSTCVTALPRAALLCLRPRPPDHPRGQAASHSTPGDHHPSSPPPPQKKNVSVYPHLPAPGGGGRNGQ